MQDQKELTKVRMALNPTTSNTTIVPVFFGFPSNIKYEVKYGNMDKRIRGNSK
jgi:hypothetical protein